MTVCAHCSASLCAFFGQVRRCLGVVRVLTDEEEVIGEGNNECERTGSSDTKNGASPAARVWQAVNVKIVVC